MIVRLKASNTTRGAPCSPNDEASPAEASFLSSLMRVKQLSSLKNMSKLRSGSFLPLRSFYGYSISSCDWTYYISPKTPVLVCSPFWMLSWKVLSAREEFMRIWARSSSKSSFRRVVLPIILVKGVQRTGHNKPPQSVPGYFPSASETIRRRRGEIFEWRPFFLFIYL